MLHKIQFNLNITLAEGGATAEEISELYAGRVVDDIDQTAWNLCDCDDKVQSEKFGDLMLEDWSVKHTEGNDFHITAQFSVNAMDDEFVSQVIEEYMDGFADSITVTQNGYYSRTGERIGFSPYPIEWDISPIIIQ
jgi:hypothetical protein